MEKQLQLPIDYTATITLSGLRSMVDAMGGGGGGGPLPDGVPARHGAGGGNSG